MLPRIAMLVYWLTINEVSTARMVGNTVDIRRLAGSGSVAHNVTSRERNTPGYKNNRQL